MVETPAMEPPRCAIAETGATSTPMASAAPTTIGAIFTVNLARGFCPTSKTHRVCAQALVASSYGRGSEPISRIAEPGTAISIGFIHAYIPTAWTVLRQLPTQHQPFRLLPAK